MDNDSKIKVPNIEAIRDWCKNFFAKKEDIKKLQNATAINLIPYPYVIFRAGNTYRSFGVEFVFSPADGSVSLTGKTDNNGEIVSELLYDGTPKELGLRSDTEYILHMAKDILNKSFIKIGENFYTDTGEGVVFKVDKTEMDSICHIGITPNPEKTYAGEKIYPMLEIGDEAHDFVKYIARGIKINEVLQNVNDGIENALINITDKEETIEQSISNMTSGGKLKDLISHVKSFMIGAKSILDLCVKTGQIVQQNIDNQNTVPSSALVYSLVNEINSNLDSMLSTKANTNNIPRGFRDMYASMWNDYIGDADNADFGLQLVGPIKGQVGDLWYCLTFYENSNNSKLYGVQLAMRRYPEPVVLFRNKNNGTWSTWKSL